MKKIKIITTLFVIVFMMSSINDVFAVDNVYKNPDDKVNDEIIDAYNHEELIETIYKNIKETLADANLIFKNLNSNIVDDSVLIVGNGTTYKLKSITDDTKNFKILQKSFIEPILVYSSIYESEELIKSSNISKIYNFSYLYSGVVISGTTITYGKKDFNPYVFIDDNLYHAEKIRIDQMYFSWTKSGGNSFNGVTNISYCFKQGSYNTLLPPDYQKCGSYGWPDHHTFGSFTRYSNFLDYSVYVPELQNPGYARCINTITIMYNNGLSTTTRTQSVGFGGFTW